LIAGSNASFIATLVERHSRYVMLVKVPSKDTLTVVNARKGGTSEYEFLNIASGCFGAGFRRSDWVSDFQNNPN